MIELKHVCKSFGEKTVLNDVNLTIDEKTCFGLVGINGAGKSTLLRLISGVLAPDSGEVLVDGENVFDNPSAKSKIFFLADDPFYTQHVSARALADLYGTFYNFDDKLFTEFLNTFSIDEKTSLFRFSKGMRRQVFVSLAIACNPKYLLLDEAFDGLDPLARIILKKAIINMSEVSDSAVIISSHALRELEDICTNYALIDNKVVSSSGILFDQLEKYKKYQFAIPKETVFDENKIYFNVKKLQKSGQVITLITDAPENIVLQQINEFNPYFVETMELDFEELFECEVHSKGYIK